MWASFLKELLRRAAVIAVSEREQDDATVITLTFRHLDEALAELMDTRNAMTRVALGGAPPAAESADPAAPQAARAGRRPSPFRMPAAYSSELHLEFDPE